MANGKTYRSDDFTIAIDGFELGDKVLVTYISKSGSPRHVVCVVTDRVNEDYERPGKALLSWAAYRRLENHKVRPIEITVTLI